MTDRTMTANEMEEHRLLAAANILFFRAVRDAKISHADEIFAIEKDVNDRLGGDAEISEIVAIMVARGWTRPGGDE